MKNGSHAFPCMTGPNSAEGGMTLRDYFAGQVLARSVTDNIENVFLSSKQQAQAFAEKAYMIADAMIAERVKEEKK